MQEHRTERAPLAIEVKFPATSSTSLNPALQTDQVVLRSYIFSVFCYPTWSQLYRHNTLKPPTPCSCQGHVFFWDAGLAQENDHTFGGYLYPCLFIEGPSLPGQLGAAVRAPAQGTSNNGERVGGQTDGGARFWQWWSLRCSFLYWNFFVYRLDVIRIFLFESACVDLVAWMFSFPHRTVVYTVLKC